MFIKNDLGEFQAVINRILFVCDEPSQELVSTAQAIAEVYKDRLEDIATYLMDEGITEICGEISTAKLIRSLGKPIIDLERGIITYPDNALDDYYIIEFEFSGILEEFSGLCIDG